VKTTFFFTTFPRRSNVAGVYSAIDESLIFPEIWNTNVLESKGHFCPHNVHLLHTGGKYIHGFDVRIFCSKPEERKSSDPRSGAFVNIPVSLRFIRREIRTRGYENLKTTQTSERAPVAHLCPISRARHKLLLLIKEPMTTGFLGSEEHLCQRTPSEGGWERQIFKDK